jgi:multidrug efflux pump subunit AcrB
MKLPKIAIKNTQFVLIMVLIALVMGIQSLERMPRFEDPSVDFPFYNVVAIYPGTSPEDMENLIADPIEEVLDEIDDIQEIKAFIAEGLVNITIEGEFTIDPDDKFDEIIREVNSIRGDLPQGIVFFDIDQFKPENRTVIHQFAMVSESVGYSTLIDHAERLEDELKQIKALKAIDIEAYPEEEIRISLDFQRMANQHISLQQVIGILNQNNANIPGGLVKAQGRSFSIKTTGGYKNLEDLQKTVISAANGNVVYLKDIATVEMDYEDARWVGRFNGQNALFISLKLKGGNNIIQVAEEIKAIEKSFQADLPPNVELVTAFEQAPAVKARIDDFFNNLMQGVLLVGIVILLFLGWRSSFIIMFIIPLCIIISLAILNGIGYGLQQISIASLVLALGLLVDNGIVVVENINRFIKQGLPLKEAAAKGTGEVGFAIISSTVTTLLSFFPLTQLGEGAGEFLRSLPVTVMITLIISLLLALTLSPILASKILKRVDIDKPSFMDRILNAFAAKMYRPVLHFSLKRGWIMLLLAIGITAFSISLFPSIGVSFFPTADKALLLIDIECPEGTNIEKTDEAVRFVESVLDTMDFVENYTANVGNGNPQVYYNRIPKRAKKSYGQIMVNFKEWNPRKFYQTLSQMRKDFAHYPGAKITFSELKNGAPTDAPIEIQIFGENLDTLKKLASEVEQVFKNTAGIININNALSVDKTELNIRLDKEKAGLVNLSYLGFDQTVRASLTGLQFDEVSLDDGEDYPLVVRMPFDKQPGISDFNKVYFTSQTGGQIPLRQVADVHFQAANTEILHKGLNRYASVKADPIDADQTVPITIELIEKLESIPLPKGYSFFASGEYEDQQEAFGDLGTILILAQIAIFAVLVLQFRSILQPIAVFAAIPLAISGSFIALYLTGWSFSFFAFVGFISLIGIVVNSSIIMVDYINQLRSRGLDRLEAIKQGSERRLIPVVLTTITTILGLLPLTISKSNLWSPLGWTIIGGMISSTIMTLLVVPVLYKWFTSGSRHK